MVQDGQIVSVKVEKSYALHVMAITARHDAVRGDAWCRMQHGTVLRVVGFAV